MRTHFVLSAHAYPGLILGHGWAWAFFRAESSDLSHMGVYTGMGVISVWALLRANTVEHFGRWGTKAENFLQHLSQQSANPEANFNASMFMSYWRKIFSTILQRCNAKVILRKLSKLSPNHGDLDRLFDFDIQSQVH